MTVMGTYTHMKVVPILKKEIIACLTAFQESTIVCGFLTHAVILDVTVLVKGPPRNSTTYIPT